VLLSPCILVFRSKGSGESGWKCGLFTYSCAAAELGYGEGLRGG